MALINLVTFYHVILTVEILGGFLFAFGLEIVHPIWQTPIINEAFVASSGDIITDYNDSLALHHAV